ncbi:MAG: CofH family radical SAM protein [Actinobacteria bacterium]|nr:CofH family radical SAM protein [Actinomycetota bacterium]
MTLQAGTPAATTDQVEAADASAQGGANTLAAKIANGARLTRADGLQLYESVDLLELGEWARERAATLSGDGIFTNVNCHINLTNVCKASCSYCGFSRKEGEADAYVLTAEAIADRARAARAQGVTEFHLVGGLHPTLPLSYFLDAFRLLASEVPDASIKAFTAVEVDFYAERDGRAVADVLADLADAGVVSITGGGAEIFEPSVRRRVVGHNVTWERWAAVHRAAHEIGMRTSATMLYGHIESPADRVDHVLRLRELQDETGGFDVFVPLRFQPQARLADRPAPTGVEALRVFAASRLLLDNVPHIKVFSVMHGPSLSQLALDFGADDIEGTIAEYEITEDLTGMSATAQPSEKRDTAENDAAENDTSGEGCFGGPASGGAIVPDGMTAADLIRREFATLIGETGRRPLERDTGYNVSAATSGAPETATTTPAASATAAPSASGEAA